MKTILTILLLMIFDYVVGQSVETFSKIAFKKDMNHGWTDFTPTQSSAVIGDKIDIVIGDTIHYSLTRTSKKIWHSTDSGGEFNGSDFCSDENEEIALKIYSDFIVMMWGSGKCIELKR